MTKAIEGRLILWQLIGITIFTLFVLAFWGGKDAFSVLCSSLSYVLINIIYTWLFFRYKNVYSKKKFMTLFYIGEVIKLCILIILFFIFINYLPVSGLFTLIGFIGAIIIFWVACMWVFSSVYGMFSDF